MAVVIISASAVDAVADGVAVVEEVGRVVRLGIGRADVPFVDVISAENVADDVPDAEDVFEGINDAVGVNDTLGEPLDEVAAVGIARLAAADADTALLKEDAALVNAE